MISWLLSSLRRGECGPINGRMSCKLRMPQRRNSGNTDSLSRIWADQGLGRGGRSRICEPSPRCCGELTCLPKEARWFPNIGARVQKVSRTSTPSQQSPRGRHINASRSAGVGKTSVKRLPAGLLKRAC
ncbi:hypothetical protein BV20DRAFT_735372 [Pilatotrama ljubarskyi]|nr:hypothetical protein BV20DRAFT_735372 [Pilatotrama ljubarskyi]